MLVYLFVVMLVIVAVIEIPSIFRYIRSRNRMDDILYKLNQKKSLTEVDIQVFRAMRMSISNPIKISWIALKFPWKLIFVSDPPQQVQDNFKSASDCYGSEFDEYCGEWKKAMFFAAPTMWLLSMIQMGILLILILVAIAIQGNIRMAQEKFNKIKQSRLSEILCK